MKNGQSSPAGVAGDRFLAYDPPESGPVRESRDVGRGSVRLALMSPAAATASGWTEVAAAACPYKHDVSPGTPDDHEPCPCATAAGQVGATGMAAPPRRSRDADVSVPSRDRRTRHPGSARDVSSSARARGPDWSVVWVAKRRESGGVHLWQLRPEMALRLARLHSGASDSVLERHLRRSGVASDPARRRHGSRTSRQAAPGRRSGRTRALTRSSFVRRRRPSSTSDACRMDPRRSTASAKGRSTAHACF